MSRHLIPLWVHNREVGKIEAVIRRRHTFIRDVEFVLSLADPFEARLQQLATSGLPVPTAQQTPSQDTLHAVGREEVAVTRSGSSGGNGNGKSAKLARPSSVAEKAQPKPVEEEAPR